MHDWLYRYYHMGDAKGDPNMVMHTRIDSILVDVRSGYITFISSKGLYT